MRIWFSLTLLSLSVLYLAYGLQTLTILTSSGRPGPGFFPTVVGIGLVLFTTANCFKDYKERKASAQGQHHSLMSQQISKLEDNDNSHEEPCDSQNEISKKKYPKDVIWAIALLVLFIGLLKPLGAIVSMVAFMLILLWKFNPKKAKFNILYSISFPLGIYLLFEVWLRAGLPVGILGY